MSNIPLRQAADEVFARIRDLFVRSKFNEDSVEAQTSGTEAVFTVYPDGCVQSMPTPPKRSSACSCVPAKPPSSC